MKNNGWIPYWNQVRDDKANYTYSVDNIVMQGKCPYHRGVDDFLSYLEHDVTLNFTSFNSGKMGAYHHQFRFELPGDVGFFVGVGMNSPNGVSDTIGIDFNPNKTMQFGDFVKVLNRWLSVCVPVVKRFDLAVDLPYLRQNVFMQKNRRKLSNPLDNVSSEFRTSWENHTSYLGRRSNAGYVKLYNKQSERQLNYPMTRLELTLDMDRRRLDEFMPEVLYLDDVQLVYDLADERGLMPLDEEGKPVPRRPKNAITATDRFILACALDFPERLSMLGYVKRKKISKLVNLYTNRVELNNEICHQMYDQAYRYTKPFELERYIALPSDGWGSKGTYLFDFDEIEV